jgi:hypothetical protein
MQIIFNKLISYTWHFLLRYEGLETSFNRISTFLKNYIYIQSTIFILFADPESSPWILTLNSDPDRYFRLDFDRDFDPESWSWPLILAYDFDPESLL